MGDTNVDRPARPTTDQSRLIEAAGRWSAAVRPSPAVPDAIPQRSERRPAAMAGDPHPSPRGLARSGELRASASRPSDTFANEHAGCAGVTKDQGGRGDRLFRPTPGGGLRRLASVYDRVSEVQRELGVTRRAVYRAEVDPNILLVMQEFRSSEQAHSFFEHARNREVLQYAGVDVGSLRLEFYDPA